MSGNRIDTMRLAPPEVSLVFKNILCVLSYRDSFPSGIKTNPPPCTQRKLPGGGGPTESANLICGLVF